MAGPRIPQWQAQQGIQSGAMSGAYESAGALFGKALEAGQNILDDKIARESAQVMEGILGANSAKAVNEQRALGAENVWADQAMLGAASLEQKDKITERRDAAAQRKYDRSQDAKKLGLDWFKAKSDDAYKKGTLRAKGRSAAAAGIGAQRAAEEALSKEFNNHYIQRDMSLNPIVLSRDSVENVVNSAVAFARGATGEEGERLQSGPLDDTSANSAVNAALSNLVETDYNRRLATYMQNTGIEDPNQIPLDIRQGFLASVTEGVEQHRDTIERSVHWRTAKGQAEIRGMENELIAQSGLSKPERLNESLYALRGLLPDGQYAQTLSTFKAPTSAEELHVLNQQIVNASADALANSVPENMPMLRDALRNKGADLANSKMTDFKSGSKAIAELTKYFGAEAVKHHRAELAKELDEANPGKSATRVGQQALIQGTAKYIEDLSEATGHTPEELGLPEPTELTAPNYKNPWFIQNEGLGDVKVSDIDAILMGKQKDRKSDAERNASLRALRERQKEYEAAKAAEASQKVESTELPAALTPEVLENIKSKNSPNPSMLDLIRGKGK